MKKVAIYEQRLSTYVYVGFANTSGMKWIKIASIEYSDETYNSSTGSYITVSLVFNLPSPQIFVAFNVFLGCNIVRLIRPRSVYHTMSFKTIKSITMKTNTIKHVPM